MEILHDYSIIELISSILRLTNKQDVRLFPQQYPAFGLVRRRCNRLAVEDVLHSNINNSTPLPHSPIDAFPFAVERFNSVELLPDHHSHLGYGSPSSPIYEKWESRRFKNHCRGSSQELQTHRAVMESRGHHFTVGGLRSTGPVCNVPGHKPGSGGV